jgi:hypothetical protein
MNHTNKKVGRPARKVPVIKTAWYATDDDIDSINRIRVYLFEKERLQASTNTDVISIVLKKYGELIGIRKQHANKT